MRATHTRRALNHGRRNRLVLVRIGKKGRGVDAVFDVVGLPCLASRGIHVACGFNQSANPGRVSIPAKRARAARPSRDRATA
jgi:hypothetical protein